MSNSLNLFELIGVAIIS